LTLTNVASRKCSARIWRSEVEVTLNPLDTFAESLSLKERQRHRTACSCSEIDRGQDPYVHTMQKLRKLIVSIAGNQI
jgi:hypothetical protein